MTGKIYYISNDINDKLYVGKTVRPTLNERFTEHRKDSLKIGKEKRPLYRAMRKYGGEHFSIHLIEECEISKLAEREQYWIDYYNAYHNGYNATLGGDGAILYDYALFVEDYQEGMLIIEIAEKHGCSPDTVTNALKLANIDGHKNAIDRSKHKVYQYDKNNTFIQSFESQRDAARYLISKGHKGTITSIATNIGRVLKGQRKTAEGFVWKSE